MATGRDIREGDGEKMDDKVTYRQQVNFCGKPRCRKCREGIGHGPYWFAYRITPEGRTVRTYIGKQLPPDIVSPSATSDPSTPSAVTSAREGQHGEIDTLDHLLAKDPT